MFAFLMLFCVGFVAGLAVIVYRIRRIDRTRRAGVEAETSWDGHGFTLVRAVAEETHLINDASLEDIVGALAELSEESDVTVIAPGGGQLRAEGTRAAFQIYFEPPASARPLVIGRPSSGMRRGKAKLSGERILVTPLEIWSRDDGASVFEAFIDGRDLTSEFVLRDPTVQASTAEIRSAIGRA